MSRGRKTRSAKVDNKDENQDEWTEGKAKDTNNSQTDDSALHNAPGNVDLSTTEDAGSSTVDEPVGDPLDSSSEQRPSYTSGGTTRGIARMPRKRRGRWSRGASSSSTYTDVYQSTTAGPSCSEVSSLTAKSPWSCRKRHGKFGLSRGGNGSGTSNSGRSRHSSSLVTRVAVDKDGTMMDIIEDEVDMPKDPEGEKKVDALGNLLGNRKYRVRTFELPERGNRLYMLSTEPARCTGFRDSYLFFTKHMMLHKIIIEESEKLDLIRRNIIPSSYRGRTIGVVTARSVFRVFGSKIIVGGRKVIDDYYESESRARGDVEGELADPDDKLPEDGEPYNQNQYVAWLGTNHSSGNTGTSAPQATPKSVCHKKRQQVSSISWQLDHSKAASRFNSSLLSKRRLANSGVYDVHTNYMHFPRNMQPSHVRWQIISSNQDNNSPPPPSLTNSSTDRQSKSHSSSPSTSNASLFPPVPPIVARNYLVTDLYMESMPSQQSILMEHAQTLQAYFQEYPSESSNAIILKWFYPYALPPADFSPIPLFQIPAAQVNQLPSTCKSAFGDAVTAQLCWKNRWIYYANFTSENPTTFVHEFNPFPDSSTSLPLSSCCCARLLRHYYPIQDSPLGLEVERILRPSSPSFFSPSIDTHRNASGLRISYLGFPV